MRKNQFRKTSVMLALAGLLSSFVVFVSSGTASAAESIPTLQWPAVTVQGYSPQFLPSYSAPNGNITVPCAETTEASRNLVTYSATGKVLRNIDRNSYVDGVKNCIDSVATDKNGDIYGQPYGMKMDRTGSTRGPNLLAYKGATIKWKYPVSTVCPVKPGVGANGNVYLTTLRSDGTHLIGLKPELGAGKTKPTKVLDVKVPAATICLWQVHPYKAGIALVNAQKIRFYSYSGKFIDASPYITQNGPPPMINAEGKQFFSSVEGHNDGTGFDRDKISKYDPTTRSVLWTAQINTPGASSYSDYFFPVRGGGAVTISSEVKLASPGVPASPYTRVNKLTYFNGSGQLAKQFFLPEKDARGNAYQLRSFASDLNGKVAILMSARVPSGRSAPAMVNVVDIMVWDLQANAWVYQKRMGGAAADGLRGYDLVNDFGGWPVFTKDTLTIMASCSYGCSSTASKLYPLRVLGLQMEQLRGDTLTATSVPSAPVPMPYVAMGDSFSAGEGVEPFSASSSTDTNKCHRSDFAYSQVISRNPTLTPSLETGKFVACSGATTKHLAGKWSADDVSPGDPVKNLDEAPQLDALNGSTKVVSLTIGGNDMGFGDFGLACINPLSACNVESSAYATASNKLKNEVPQKLTTAYRQILLKAPKADVYVMGYPHVAPVKDRLDGGGDTCPYLYYSGYDHWGNAMLWGDAQAAREIVDLLNQTIKSVVDTVRAEAPGNVRLHYVEVNGTDSPFKGHEICSTGTSYFQNLDQATHDKSYVFHPNAMGQKAYAQLLIAEMKRVNGHL